MSNDAFPSEHLSPWVRRLSGRFKMNGTSDPDFTTFKGRGVKSITYGAVGKYILTLDSGYSGLLSGSCNPTGPSGGTHYAGDIGAEDFTTNNPTVVLQVLDYAGAAVAPHASGSGYEVHFSLELAYSSRTLGS